MEKLEELMRDKRVEGLEGQCAAVVAFNSIR